MNLSTHIKPVDYETLLGNKEIKERLKKDREIVDTIFYGHTGCGKSSIAEIYAKQGTKCNGSTVKTEELRSFKGNIIINEIHNMNVSKQGILLEMIDSGLVKVIATTTEMPSQCLIAGLYSRLRQMRIMFPTLEEIKPLIDRILNNSGYSIEEGILEDIVETTQDMRVLIDTVGELINNTEQDLITKELYGKLSLRKVEKMSVESLKSALQKSIRGSNVDASILYANKLLDLGHLEILCRRLQVTVCEDIGLASPNAVVILNSLVDSALKLGLPECKYPIIQAVIYLALQPKSNSVHEAVKKVKGFNNFTIPTHIESVHPKDYKYPHNYVNNYVQQDYLPEELDSVKFYEPGRNKIESSYKEYWSKIKV